MNGPTPGAVAGTTSYRGGDEDPWESAACRAHDPEMWFDPESHKYARLVCNDCPLRYPCLTGALERREPWGVWGGDVFVAGVAFTVGREPRPKTTPAARPAARSGPPAAPTRLVGCGTPSGYRNHYKRGEEPCPDCVTARQASRDVAKEAAARRTAQRRAQAQVPPCGTRKAYDRHLQRGEPTCDACKAYKAAASRTSRQRNRQQRPAQQAEQTAA